MMCVTRDEFLIIPDLLFYSSLWLHIALNTTKKSSRLHVFEALKKEKRLPFPSFHSICCYLKKKHGPCPPVPSACNSTRQWLFVCTCVLSRLVVCCFIFSPLSNLLVVCTSNYIDSRSVYMPLNKKRIPGFNAGCCY